MNKSWSFAGFTPLLKSASVGNEEIIRTLIENRTNVNATNDDGDSALTLAARSSKNHFWNTKCCTNDTNRKTRYYFTPSK